MDLPSCAGMALAQGATVALPRRAAGRLRAPLTLAWVVPPVAFAAAVVALARRPDLAREVSLAGLVAVPALAAVAIAAVARGGRPAAAAVVPPLVVAACVWSDRVAGQCATLVLLVLSATALGALAARVGDARRVALGVAALAAADVVLLVAGDVGRATAALEAVDLGGLPPFGRAVLGSFHMGYADFAVAGLAGAVTAARSGTQLRVGALTLVFALAQGAVMQAGRVYPGTLPVVLALAVDALATRGARRGARTRPGAGAGQDAAGGAG